MPDEDQVERAQSTEPGVQERPEGRASGSIDDGVAGSLSREGSEELSHSGMRRKAGQLELRAAQLRGGVQTEVQQTRTDTGVRAVQRTRGGPSRHV